MKQFIEALAASVMFLGFFRVPLISGYQVYGSGFVLIAVALVPFGAIALYIFCRRFPSPIYPTDCLRHLLRRRHFSYVRLINGTTSRMFQNTKHQGCLLSRDVKRTINGFLTRIGKGYPPRLHVRGMRLWFLRNSVSCEALFLIPDKGVQLILFLMLHV